MQAYRTFIAIELPSDLRRKIKARIDQLRTEFPDVRASWSREDNLHLTLKFLGEVPVDRIPALSDAVAKAASTVGSFELIVVGCGTFPSHGRPKVLWIGIKSAEIVPSSSTLLNLYSALEDACAVAGFEREVRAYHPHLTIARLREAKGTRALAERNTEIGFAPEIFTATELVVFRSELSSKGSIHTALSRQELSRKAQ